MAWSNPMNTSNQYIKYQIGVHLISQNVANNTSNVYVYVKVYRTNTGYNTSGTGTVYCRINGVLYSADINSNQYINENGIVLFTRNMNITHSVVGQKTLDCSAWINHSRFSSNEQAYSENLPNIARATTPVVSPNPIVLGNELTISLPRASNAFTHNMRYVCGNLSGVIAEGVGTEYKWTIPLNFASQFPKSDSGVCSIVCYTFYNGSQVGYKIVNFKVTINPGAMPPVKNIRWVDVNGYRQKYNASFIQNKSLMRFEIEAEGTQGSTIEKITFDIDGKYHSENTTGVFESLVFTQTAGEIHHKCEVVDSRGRVTTLDPLIYNVCAYDSPRISKFDARRCNADGTPNDEGAYMKINYAAIISPIYNLNSKRFTVFIKPQDSTSWSIPVNIENVYEVDNSVIVAANTEKAYDLVFEIKDDFETVRKSWSLSTAFTLVDFNKSGKGMAVGKVSEKNEFECALPATFKSVKTQAGVDLDVLNSSIYSVDASGKRDNTFTNLIQVVVGGVNANSRVFVTPKTTINGFISRVSLSNNVVQIVASSAFNSGQEYTFSILVDNR